MKTLKSILRKFDVFAVPLSFRYKNEDKYSTSFGGLIFILFIIGVLIPIIYSFIPFITRKNFSLVYYSMKLPTAERIKLKESKAAFAIGFDCREGSDGTKAEDILQLNINYLIYKKFPDGSRKKFPEPLSSHKCTYADFYNQYNFTFDLLNLQTFECLDNTDHVIEGIFTDEIFSYYEFSVLSKEDSEENFNRIDDYLTENDCKIVIYYTDITFDLNNYEEPIKPFLSEIFMQLNPILFLKMNAYFMNQYFADDDYMFFNLEDNKPITRTLYSREEMYSLYKGLRRYDTKRTDYQYYMKIYIRADTKKTEVKRRYQKLMEFYADTSSLLEALFQLIFFVITFINSFYAEHSLSKKIFLFKEVESHHLDISLKKKQIKNLIDLTEPFENILLPSSFRRSKRRNFSEFKKGGSVKDLEKEEIRIANIRINNGLVKDQVIEKESRKGKKSRTIRKKSQKFSIVNVDQNDMQTIKMNSSKNESNLLRLNINSNLIKSKVEDFTIEETIKKKIKYTFNIFEIFLNSFCCCCLSKNMRLKRQINLKANSLLNYNLDIVLFTRNMILLDLFGKTLLDQDKKNIFNFLSRPIVFTNKEIESENNGFYNNYSEDDFENLYDEIAELAEKSDKLITEKRLISLSNHKLKELI